MFSFSRTDARIDFTDAGNPVLEDGTELTSELLAGAPPHVVGAVASDLLAELRELRAAAAESGSESTTGTDTIRLVKGRRWADLTLEERAAYTREHGHEAARELMATGEPVPGYDAAA